MAGGAGVHHQVLIGGHSERTAQAGQTGNKLWYWQLELAHEHTARGGHGEAGAVLPGGQCQRQIGDQKRLADFGFAAHEENALRWQKSRFDPAGRRGGRLLGQQLRQREHRRGRRILGGAVFHSSTSAVASSKMASLMACSLRAAAKRRAVKASLLTLRRIPLLA